MNKITYQINKTLNEKLKNKANKEDVETWYKNEVEFNKQFINFLNGKDYGNK